MKSLTRIVITLAVAGSTLAIAGAPADAASCTATRSGTNGASATCTSGTYRVGVECVVLKPGDPISTIHYGAWKSDGVASTRSCAGGSRLFDFWAEQG
jgi:hypothetical protein